MKIAIDGNEANTSHRVGIGEYAYQLLAQFEKISSSNIEFEIYLKNPPLSDLPAKRVGWSYKVFGPGKMWTQFALPLKLFGQGKKPDIFFSPSHYGPRFSPVKNAISIMDLSFIYFPYLFNKRDLNQLKSWTAYSAKKASLIFTISNSSKNDILKEYQLPSNRVVVTHLGVKQDNKDTKVKDIKNKYKIEGDYILFVGTLQPRKNIERLIEAFSKIDNKDLKLVIVGKKGWQYEAILAAPEKYGISSKVMFLDFVPDEDLVGLYSEALCYVLPSLYEGFGLPILEAMKYGCPVITSNVSSMPEAGGDAALYVNPEDVSDITKKLDELTSNEKLRKELIEKGYEQVKKFSWEKTAKQTLEALEDLAKNGK
jgi:glycosyltransferase involved in cell wall biosynthesis